jgi:hypothetical protein
MYKKRSRVNPGIFSFDELAFEIGFFCLNSFFSSLCSGSFFTASFFSAAALFFVAAAFFVTAAVIFAAAILAAALAQQGFCPSDDLVTVGSDDIDSTCNSSQCSQNL